jgi:adenine/guanine phosphoribosyltransferase-like PRPP-binding protein
MVTCVSESATPSGIDLRACRILHVDLPPERPAKRIAHELDGIDRPVAPHQLLVAGSALWGAWLDYRPGVVPEVLIGLGTSGIIPTIAVAIAAGLPYHLAWPLDRDDNEEFPAPESKIRRREVLASGHLQGKRVLVVDDELIHGYTLASFISALRDEAADVVGVLCLIEDTTGTGRSRVESTGVALCALRTL